MDPKYDNPPVVERVIGVQFAELAFFTNAHAGWFWKSYLDEEWTHINEVPRLESKIENFESKKRGIIPQLTVQTMPTPERHQIVRKTDDRMIQIQNTRFILNWRKKDNQDYMDFESIYGEFQNYFDKFKDFVRDAGGEELQFNQWEITYVNHIFKGELWNNIDDWTEIFPGLSIPRLDIYKKRLDTLNMEWAVNLQGNTGRLHIKLNHAVVKSQDEPEIIRADFTSRGPINASQDYQRGLFLGHEAIVNTFTEITSESAHKYWRRRS
ncbi:MAG: TIGR04255 family protein [Gammaproteobacteria bacterium]|nr:MAG: TIGR04255 family protein [Gammaproteobacteria bacterium]